jgi:glycine/D-amino acid oxidase-like deaminating enzyme
MTPDGEFLIDDVLKDGKVWLASCCSGHGFKFGPLVGRILADLCCTGTTQEVSPSVLQQFSLARLLPKARL